MHVSQNNKLGYGNNQVFESNHLGVSGTSYPSSSCFPLFSYQSTEDRLAFLPTRI
jgi:hypothetical protein